MNWLLFVALFGQTTPFALVETVYLPLREQNREIVGEAVLLIDTRDTSRVSNCLRFLRQDSLDAPTFYAVIRAFNVAGYRYGQIQALRRIVKTSVVDRNCLPLIDGKECTYTQPPYDGSWAKSKQWDWLVSDQVDELIGDVCDMLLDSIGADAGKLHPDAATRQRIMARATLPRLFFLFDTLGNPWRDTTFYPYLSRFPASDSKTIIDRYRTSPSDMTQAALLQWRCVIGDVKVPWDTPPSKMRKNYEALLDTIVYSFTWSSDYPPYRTNYPELTFDQLRAYPEVYGPIIVAWMKAPWGINSSWFSRHPEYLNNGSGFQLTDENLFLLFKLGLGEPLTALFQQDRREREFKWPELELHNSIEAATSFPPDSVVPLTGFKVSNSTCFRVHEYFLCGADSLHPDTTLRRGWFPTGLISVGGWYRSSPRYTVHNDTLTIGELILQTDLIERHLDCAEILYADSVQGARKAIVAGFRQEEIAIVSELLHDWQAGIEEVRRGWSKWNVNPFPTPRLYSERREEDNRRYGEAYEFVSILCRRFSKWVTTAAPIRPMITDSDKDGLSDIEEKFLGTKLASADSDSDGVRDEFDYNPLCKSSKNLTDRQWLAKYVLEGSDRYYHSPQLTIVIAPPVTWSELSLPPAYVLHYDSKDSARVVTKYLEQCTWYLPPKEFTITGDSAHVTLLKLFHGQTATRWEFTFSREKIGWRVTSSFRDDQMDQERFYYPNYNAVQEGGC